MKKIAFVALLSISIAAIAATSGNSQNNAITTYTNVADTTPMHHSTLHKTMMHKKTTVKKPVKDSTKM